MDFKIIFAGMLIGAICTIVEDRRPQALILAVLSSLLYVISISMLK